MTEPEHDWDVLDTSCGSGGFLLYALDYIRHQANEYYEKVVLTTIVIGMILRRSISMESKSMMRLHVSQR